MRSKCILLVLCVLCGLHLGAAYYYLPDTRGYLPNSEELESVPICYHKDKFAKIHKFVNGGLGKLFWDEIWSTRNGQVLPSNVSSQCLADLQSILASALSGKRNGLKFVDSTSSAPSGYLEGSVTGFGDFDQCVSTIFEIDSLEQKDNLNGQNCFINLYPLDFLGVRINGIPYEESEDIVSIANRTLHALSSTMSLCVPTTCDPYEIRALAAKSLECFPIHVGPEVSCDTLETVNFAGKLKQMKASQKVAIFVLTTVIVSCSLAAYFNISSGILGCFNLREINRDVFLIQKGEEQRSDFITLNKMVFIYVGVTSHIILCPESPRFSSMFTHQKRFVDLFKGPIFQLLGNESNFTQMAYYGGLSAYFLISKTLLTGKVSTVRLFFDKWLRIIPVVVMLLALELVWPLIASGPFYNETAGNVIEKADKYWWCCILGIVNFNHFFRSVLKTPIIHTFYSYIDLQLFILGLVLVPLLHRKPMKGFLACISIAVIGYSILYYVVKVNDVIPHILSPHITIQNLVKTFECLHLAFYTYLPSYMVGLVLAYAVNGRKIGFESNLLLIAAQFVGGTMVVIGFIGPVSYGYFELIPREWTPIYVVIQKLLLLMGLGIQYFREDYERRKCEAKTRIKRKKYHEKDQFSLFQGLIRISFSCYIINYWIIRLDFFTHRELISTTLHSTAMRLISCLTFIVIGSYIFHLFFYAPLDRIRRKYFEPAIKPIETGNNNQ